MFVRFTLIKEHLVEFNQLAMANAEGLDHMLNRVMPKDNIGLAALLQTTEAAWENSKLFCTHAQTVLEGGGFKRKCLVAWIFMSKLHGIEHINTNNLFLKVVATGKKAKSLRLEIFLS